jgi:large subunit ribosomal protein L25
MEFTDINVKTRDSGTGKNAAHAVRMGGMIPAVVYAKGVETIHVAVDRATFVSTFTDSSRRLFNLKGLGKDVHALLREAQYDPMGDVVIHLDFQRVTADEPVAVRVPLDYRGEPKGVKGGGRFKRAARNVKIAAKPTEIPPMILVKVDDLDQGDRIAAEKLELGPGVKLLDNPNRTICSVKKRVLAKKVDPVAAAAPGAVPVAGKDDKKGAAAPAAAKPDDKKKK